jgi:hypothetical protein
MRPLYYHEAIVSVLAAGLTAGLIFCVGGMGLTVLPLLLIGLAQGARQTSAACGTACIVIGVLLSPAYMILFSVLFMLPSYYFVQRVLLWRGPENARTWFPPLRLLTEMTIMFAAYLMLFAFAAKHHGGLQAVVQYVAASIKVPDPQVAVQMKQVLDESGFALFAFIGWLCILLLYGFAVLANAILKLWKLNLRPSLAIEQEGLTRWLLFLLLLSGLLSALGQEMDKYTAKAVFSILLLPYFLCGLTFVHQYSFQRQLYMRRFWIICFYTSLTLLTLNFGGWAILMVAAGGLYSQLAEILDRHKKIG